MSRVMVAAGSRSLFDIARAKTLQSGGETQMLSEVAREALTAADNPDCEILDLASLVERDTRLTAEVLTMANSAAYATNTPIINLYQAVSRLGLGTCKNLILTTSVLSMMRRMSLENEWVHEQLWRHSFATALLAVQINRILRLGFQGEEFTAGLIHDIGRTLYAAAIPEEFAALDPLSFDEHPDLLAAEVELAGASHCELGAWFLEHNRLPEPLVAVVRHHHEPQHALSHRTLAALIATADHMANHLQRSESAEGYDLAQNPALAVLRGAAALPEHTRLDERARELMQAVLDDGLWNSSR